MTEMRPPTVVLRTGHTIAACVALLLAITGLRLAVANPFEAIGFLYVMPISLAAMELGWRGGLAAAAAAIGLTFLWAMVQEVPLGLLGFSGRITMFAGVGVLIGLQSEQLRRVLREREQLVLELEASARRDQLTGLPNRRAWEERFAEELTRASRSGDPLSVAIVDLDGFKLVNDSRGHAEGDRLLRRQSEAWSSAIRASDFLARLGGDEFLVAFPACGASEAMEVASRMLESTEEPLGASIGIVEWDGCSGEALVARADLAMYEAKAAGGRQIAIAERESAPAAR
jgi:diguanylate cyclase (GGDEF)-like protein